MPRGSAKNDANIFRGTMKYFDKLPPNDQALILDVKARSDAKWAAVAAKVECNAEFEEGRKREKTARGERPMVFVANGFVDEGTKGKKAKTEGMESKDGNTESNGGDKSREQFSEGISLPVPQLNTLLSILPGLETALAAAGESMQRAVYDGKRIAAKVKDEDEEEEKKEAQTKKRNVALTSEEDE